MDIYFSSRHFPRVEIRLKVYTTKKLLKKMVSIAIKYEIEAEYVENK